MPAPAVIRLDRTLYTDDAGNVVELGDPAARYLLGSKGAMVPLSLLETLGVGIDAPGEVVSSPATESEPDSSA